MTGPSNESVINQKRINRRTRPDTRPIPVADGWAGAEMCVFTLSNSITTDGPTDGRTDGRTKPQLKIVTLSSHDVLRHSTSHIFCPSSRWSVGQSVRRFDLDIFFFPLSYSSPNSFTLSFRLLVRPSVTLRWVFFFCRSIVYCLLGQWPRRGRWPLIPHRTFFISRFLWLKYMLHNEARDGSLLRGRRWTCNGMG